MKQEPKWLLAYGNKKYRQYGRKLLTFGLPAHRSSSGVITCPGAGKCLQGCYAQQGWYRASKVREIQEGRLRATQQPGFATRMIHEIHTRKPRYVRIHDSGDFYNMEYLNMWVAIAYHCHDVFFFTYSKMVPFVKTLIKQDNFAIVLSEGGLFDSLIDRTNDLFARVFASRKEIRTAGFVDGSKDDLALIRKGCKKIGLVYHGWKSRQFHTGPRS